jgi:hypothetical protein
MQSAQGFGARAGFPTSIEQGGERFTVEFAVAQDRG